VIAAAVRAGFGVSMVEAAENLNERPARLQWFQRAFQLKLGAFTGRPPGGRNGAIREVKEGGPQRRTRRGGCQFGGGGRFGEKFPGAERLKGRQRDQRAEAAQEMAPTQAWGVRSLRGIHGFTLTSLNCRTGRDGCTSATVTEARRF